MDNGNKVAFIAHGFADDYFTPWWRPVREKFEEWGYDIVEINFDGLARTVDSPRKYAEVVEDEIDKMYDELEEKYQDAEIVVVGHSMGGVVARYFVEKLGYEEEVDKIITFGSPHQGTYFALPFSVPVLGPKGAVDLRPGSQFIESLNRDGVSPHVDYASIYTVNDPIIIPSKNAALPNPKPNDRNIKIGRTPVEIGIEVMYGGRDKCVNRGDILTGHISVFYNDETWKAVADFLGVEDPGKSVRGEFWKDVRDDARWMAEGVSDRVRKTLDEVI